MKRWQKIKLRQKSVFQILANCREIFPDLEDRNPEFFQDAVRTMDVAEYALLACLHHLELEDVPGSSGYFCANRGAAISLDYFFGPWRETHFAENRKKEKPSVVLCRQRLDWINTFVGGLFCASITQDANCMGQLWKWADDDLKFDEGSWDYSVEANYFYIFLGLLKQGRKPEVQLRLRQSIVEGKATGPKIWLEAIDSIADRDTKTFSFVITKLLDYHLKNEFCDNNPMRAVLVNGTIFWELARMSGMKLPQLSVEIGNRIITKETVSAAR